MADSERPSYVAFFDILGFRELVKTKDLSPLALEMRVLRGKASLMAMGLNCKSIQFSDSILGYTEGIEAGNLEQIIAFSSKLMGSALRQGFALRGGIAAGEFSHEGETFLGKAMNRAYEIEEAQDWAGIVLDPGILRRLPQETNEANAKRGKELDRLVDEFYVIPWSTPIKGGSFTLNCVNWIADFHPRWKVEERVGLTGSESLDVLRKIHHTDHFLNSVRNHMMGDPRFRDRLVAGWG